MSPYMFDSTGGGKAASSSVSLSPSASLKYTGKFGKV